MDELSARAVLLAQAIETADSQGKLLTDAERQQVDRDARQEAVALGQGSGKVPDGEFLLLRARRLLAAVGVRHPSYAAMLESGPWGARVAWAAPLAALAMGVLTDAVGNPHRVDLLSLPLLGIVAWNLAVYLAIAVAALFGPGGRRRPLIAEFGRWSDGEQALRRRPGNLRTQVSAAFHARWFAATQALHAERVKRVLHVAAAAWALGVALSLLVRGLVVEYRVGWESTFLDASQVHAVLSVLRVPALLLFPFEPFSVQDVAQLQFSRGGGAVAAARWVYLYVALLLVIVIVPRIAFGAVAWWRGRMLARDVRLDLSQPYYQRIISLLAAVRVQLCLLAHREEDAAALLRVLSPTPATEAPALLLTTEFGDALRLVQFPATAELPPLQPADGWLDRLRAALGGKAGGPSPDAHAPVREARSDSDVVLHVVSSAADLVAGRPLTDWLGKPVLVLATGPIDAGALRPGERLLAVESFARCWVQERKLLDAVGQQLPPERAPGYARLVQAWDARNDTRLVRSMTVIADHLLFAARQMEEVATGALTVKNLIPAQREAQASARQRAMDAIAQRLDTSAAEMFARLRKLHGVPDDAGDAWVQAIRERFVVQQAIDTPQAGLAGAATGAAMGATVDLMAGGLTLGAAAALGALVGGSAAYVAAAWKNRASPSGGTIVQLSDAMMHALAEAALLRYFIVVHCGASGYGSVAEPSLAWKDEVTAALDAQKELLAPFWTLARSQPNPNRLVQPLAHDLETAARKALRALYPEAVP